MARPRDCCFRGIQVLDKRAVLPLKCTLILVESCCEVVSESGILQTLRMVNATNTVLAEGCLSFANCFRLVVLDLLLSFRLRSMRDEIVGL